MSREVREHYARLASGYRRKANRSCDRAYRALVRRWLNGASSVLELGAGSACLIGALDAPKRVACDLTVEMLRAATPPEGMTCVSADAERLPFPDASFDAVFSVNLVEHVPHPDQLFAEIARVLKPGGHCLVVTPNGDIERLLHVLERLHLKLPEGPHRFLGKQALLDAATPRMELVEHRRFLAFPAGPPWFVDAIDAFVPGHGLFQYVVLRKQTHMSPTDSTSCAETRPFLEP